MRRFTGPKLIIATHNAGKLAEMRAFLAPYSVALTGNADHGLPEPVEDGTTFAANARLKAHAATRATGLPALADDSGIEIDGLDGRPGIHTADWAETPAGRDFPMAMARTWRLLEDANAPHPRTAKFCCTLALAWPDGDDAVFAGAMPGQIVWPTRGAGGHGYDPMFQPQGHDITFGEMDPAQKNRISHRADAVAQLIAACFA